MLKSPVIVTGLAAVPSSIVSCLLFEFPGSPLSLAEGAMVEGMQRGRQSTAFDGGALAPEMDQPAHCFNKIAARAIIQALDIQNPRLSP